MKEPKDKRTKSVYIHISHIDNKIFYVGCGGKYRATLKAQRTSLWNEVAKHGYDVKILKSGLSIDEALELEDFIIKTIGIDNLSNQGNHLTWGKGAWNKGKKDYLSEESKRKMGLSIARRCVNILTNKEYETLKDACEDCNVSYSTTHKKLNGHLKNVNNNIKYI